MKNNLILIGMPGCGKSTLGVILAKTLGYDFIDTDLIIQKQQGKKLYEIIDNEGIDAFISCEREAICTIFAEASVIATGGSVVLDPCTMEHLSSLGKIIYIKLPREVIEKRINNISTRGIVMSKGKSIADIYRERTPLYEEYAELTLCPENDNIESTIEKLIKALK